MRFIKACVLLLLSAQASSALVTPTSSVQKKQSSSTVVVSPKSTRLHSGDVAVDVPRGGRESGGTATIPTEVFNLIKSIVGAGVLSLPAGR